jgi:hypothetical protein
MLTVLATRHPYSFALDAYLAIKQANGNLTDPRPIDIVLRPGHEGIFNHG